MYTCRTWANGPWDPGPMGQWALGPRPNGPNGPGTQAQWAKWAQRVPGPTGPNGSRAQLGPTGPNGPNGSQAQRTVLNFAACVRFEILPVRLHAKSKRTRPYSLQQQLNCRASGVLLSGMRPFFIPKGLTSVSLVMPVSWSEGVQINKMKV